MKKHQDRIVYLDLLRIFAVFSMIVLHLSASQWGNIGVTSYQWQILNLYNSAVRFCVPVLIMISGAMFLDLNRQIGIKKLFCKNIARIITAFLFWSTAYGILVPAVIFKQDLNLLEITKSIISGHYHLWFLFTLVGLYIAVPILRKICEDGNLVKYYLVFIFLFCYGFKFISNLGDTPADLVTVISGKASLGLFGGYIGYFLLGHYLTLERQKNWLVRHRYQIYGLGILSYLFTVAASYFSSVGNGVAFDGWYSYFSPNITLISIAIFLLFQHEISKIQWGEASRDKITLVSNLSFGIYLVHEFFIQIFHSMGYTTLSYNPIFSVPVMALAIFVGSFLIAYLISKINFLNHYII